MIKILLGLVIAVMMTANSNAITKEDHSFDEFIYYWDDPSKNLGNVYASGYIKSLFNSMIVHQNLTATLNGLETRKFCLPNDITFNDKPEMDKIINLMRKKYYEENYKQINTNTAYVMFWTLVDNFPCSNIEADENK